jgi:hypothetical protein
MNIHRSTDRVITVVLLENPQTKFEASHPVEIIGVGSGKQVFNLTIGEANSLCDQLVKATLLASLKQMNQEAAEPKPIHQTSTPIYVKQGAIGGGYKDGGTQEYMGWDGKHYFVDHRIGSNTKGAIYDRYPGNKGAILLADAKLVECNVPPYDDDRFH